MVTTAFLFLTVSTLAAHINAVPTKLNHDPCEGNTLCLEKPADYPPEEEMNHIVANSDLRHFYRVKREIDAATGNANEVNGCVKRREPPARTYASTDINSIIREILQAKSFRHLLPVITCKNTTSDQSCFNFKSRVETGCQPVISRVNLKIKKITVVEQDITTGCRCDFKIANVEE